MCSLSRPGPSVWGLSLLALVGPTPASSAPPIPKGVSLLGWAAWGPAEQPPGLLDMTPRLPPWLLGLTSAAGVPSVAA